jgi:peptidoglycan-associated lipoprotein
MLQLRRTPSLVLAAALLTAACHRNRPAPPAAQPAPVTPAPPRNDAPPPPRADDGADRARAERERAERERLAELRRTLETTVYFGFDRSDLTAEARQALEAKVPVLAGSPDIRIVIEGHADETGSDEYNLALGQRRAAAAKRFLVGREIDASRIEIASLGEERPACTGMADDCLARNRRAEFRITAGGPVVAHP